MTVLFTPSIEFDEHLTFINVCPYTKLTRWIIQREESQRTRYLVVHLPEGYDVSCLEDDYAYGNPEFFGVSTSLICKLETGGYRVYTYEPYCDLDNGKVAIAHVDPMGKPITLDLKTLEWFAKELVKFTQVE